MRIRRIEATDLAGILALYHELHPREDLPSDEALAVVWPQLLTDNRVIVLVGELEGTLVTTCTLTTIPNLTRGARPYGVVENVVTTRQRRGQGLGTAILQHALQYAWAEGCYKVMLVSPGEPEETLRFLEGAGFDRAKAVGLVARPRGDG